VVANEVSTDVSYEVDFVIIAQFFSYEISGEISGNDSLFVLICGRMVFCYIEAKAGTLLLHESICGI
jgi:hypothetical protein